MKELHLFMGGNRAVHGLHVPVPLQKLQRELRIKMFLSDLGSYKQHFPLII